MTKDPRQKEYELKRYLWREYCRELGMTIPEIVTIRNKMDNLEGKKNGS